MNIIFVNHYISLFLQFVAIFEIFLLSKTIYILILYMFTKLLALQFSTIYYFERNYFLYLNMFLFLFCFLVPNINTNFVYHNHSIAKNSISSSIINNSTSADACLKIIARTNQIYHLSNEGVYQSWTKGSLSQTAQQ